MIKLLLHLATRANMYLFKSFSWQNLRFSNPHGEWKFTTTLYISLYKKWGGHLLYKDPLCVNQA